jgi:hypothetical protein
VPHKQGGILSTIMLPLPGDSESAQACLCVRERARYFPVQLRVHACVRACGVRFKCCFVGSVASRCRDKNGKPAPLSDRAVVVPAMVSTSHVRFMHRT